MQAAGQVHMQPRRGIDPPIRAFHCDVEAVNDVVTVPIRPSSRRNAIAEISIPRVKHGRDNDGIYVLATAGDASKATTTDGEQMTIIGTIRHSGALSRFLIRLSLSQVRRTTQSLRLSIRRL